MAKIKSIKVNYPTTKEGMEKVQRDYTKALAKILIKNYPQNIIQEIIERLKDNK